MTDTSGLGPTSNSTFLPGSRDRAASRGLPSGSFGVYPGWLRLGDIESNVRSIISFHHRIAPDHFGNGTIHPTMHVGTRRSCGR
jgi:hypothetical protein